MTLEDFLISYQTDRTECLESVYKSQLSICQSWINKNFKKQPQETKDILIDAIVILSENANMNKINASSTLVSTYLLGICKNLIKQSNKNQPLYVVLDNDVKDDFNIEEFTTKLENEAFQIKTLEECLENLGHPCSTIIKEFYLNQLKQEKITTLMGYQNGNVTKSMKYKCLNRLKILFFKNNKSL